MPKDPALKKVPIYVFISPGTYSLLTKYYKNGGNKSALVDMALNIVLSGQYEITEKQE